MDCVYTNWTTPKPGIFHAADCAALRQLAPTPALKATSLAANHTLLVRANRQLC
jgi:hypothetical protein